MHEYARLVYSKLKEDKVIRKKIVYAVIVLICIGYTIFVILETNKNDEKLRNPSAASRAHNDTLIEKVGKLTELPKGESPTIATVEDVSSLKNKEFFAEAKTGFKLLLYQTSKRGILYDPINNKIVKDETLDPSSIK